MYRFCQAGKSGLKRVNRWTPSRNDQKTWQELFRQDRCISTVNDIPANGRHYPANAVNIQKATLFSRIRQKLTTVKVSVRSVLIRPIRFVFSRRKYRPVKLLYTPFKERRALIATTYIFTVTTKNPYSQGQGTVVR